MIFFANKPRTFLVHHNISEVIHQKLESMSPNLRQVASALSNNLYVEKFPSKMFPEVEKTTKTIREVESEEIKLTKLLDLVERFPVGGRALGAIVRQLSRYEIIHEVLRTSKFKEYSPMEEKKSSKTKGKRL